MICFLFMVAEVIGGYLSNSVAIMTDAAHMLSDCSGFIISILSIITIFLVSVFLCVVIATNSYSNRI